VGKIKKSQISAMNIHYRYFPLEYFLDSASDNGFSSIELWAASPHFFIDDVGPKETASLRRETDKRGLRIICFTPEQCVYPINIAAREKQIRTRSINYFEKAIDISADLECELVLITSGWGYFSEPPDEAWRRSQDSLEILLRKAETKGITLVLEPLRTDESNLVTSLPMLSKMINEISSAALKGMIDTIPMALAGETISDYFQVLGDDLRHIHFVDGKPRGHLAWGDGVLPLQKYITDLEDIAYQDYLSLEITDSTYYLDPGSAEVRSLASLMPFLNE
jgi:protein FrlC